jgi:hypothetical protein|tara:strand:+ start:1672 stop:1941 length:270 start_codon:yes stop_codon:yes gene_type:complete
MNRNHTISNHLGEIISTTKKDVTWDEVRKERKKWLEATDLWYLKDRWDALSSSAKGKLNSFRASLRSLPQDYETANEACDSFPTPEEWF